MHNMALSIDSEHQRAFNLVILRKEADVLLTGRQWEKHNALVERCDNARQKEANLFEERFDARIATEHKRLINEAGSKTMSLKPASAQDDLFDRTALLSQAYTNVRNAHDSRIQNIEDFETIELKALLQTSSRENQIQGKSERSFNKAADRRLGERRVKHSIKHTR